MWSMVLETHCAVVQAVMNALVWSAVAGPRLGAWCLSILTSAFFAPSAYGLTPSFSSCPSKEGTPFRAGPILGAGPCMLVNTHWSLWALLCWVAATCPSELAPFGMVDGA